MTMVRVVSLIRSKLWGQFFSLVFVPVLVFFHLFRVSKQASAVTFAQEQVLLLLGRERERVS